MHQSNLLRMLPVSMEDTLRKNLIPGEEVRATLPGALGEALVVTDRRVAVLRETSSGSDISLFAHPLAKLHGADVLSTPTGCALTLKTSDQVSTEQCTVYFPIDKKSDFDTVAAQIEELVRSVSRSPGERTAPATGTAGTCPGCGLSVSDRDAFCAVCGMKIRDICQACGGPMRSDGLYCPHCGSRAAPAVLECPACSGRVNSITMYNCIHCGQQLLHKCAACGAHIVSGFTHCRYCGRKIGSEEMPPEISMRTAVQRIRQEQELAAQDEPKSKPQPESGEDSAATHNAKAAELFEQDRIEEAVEEFRRAVMLAPDNGSYHCNLAVAYDELEQDEDAQREYERALELNPDDVTALLYLGYMLNENDEPERAAELWTRLTTIAPGTAEAEEAAQNLRAQGEL